MSRRKLFARPATARASKGSSSQRSRAEESTLLPALNALARVKLGSRSQTISDPRRLSAQVHDCTLGGQSSKEAPRLRRGQQNSDIFAAVLHRRNSRPTRHRACEMEFHDQAV